MILFFPPIPLANYMKVNMETCDYTLENQPKELIIIKQLTPNKLNPHWLEPKSILSPEFSSYIYCNFTLGNLNPR